MTYSVIRRSHPFRGCPEQYDPDQMGHAGAVISGGKDTAAAKMEALRSAGVFVTDSPAALGSSMVELLKG
jgi:succinyl-CoA synthetase alpha subunit